MKSFITFLRKGRQMNFEYNVLIYICYNLSLFILSSHLFLCLLYKKLKYKYNKQLSNWTITNKYCNTYLIPLLPKKTGISWIVKDKNIIVN